MYNKPASDIVPQAAALALTASLLLPYHKINK